jgi:hypothetical protein
LIALGGIVKVRYRGWRGGGKITKAAVHEFVERTLSFENSKEKFEELTLKDFIAFREKNIFGYDPPAKSYLTLVSFPGHKKFCRFLKISSTSGLP